MDYLFKCRLLSHHSNGACIPKLEVLKDILDADGLWIGYVILL